MKKTALLLAFLCFSGLAVADEYVNGYTRSNGTYVQGYHRSSPNSTTADNYSTKGNTNPYTGEEGTRSGEGSSSAPYGTGSSLGSYSPILK